MFTEGALLRGTAGSMLPTSGVLMDWQYAWLLILALLTLCCGMLWVLSRPGKGAARAASSVMSSGPKRKRQGRPSSRRAARKPFRVTAAKVAPRPI